MTRVSQRAAGRLGYVPGLDGLRGIAVLAVVANHALAIPGGFIGVDVFFVLSGFLITTLLLEEWEDAGGLSLRRFYRRRAARLYPALVATVVAFLAIRAGSAVWEPDHPSFRPALGGVAASVAYLANVWDAWVGPLPLGLRHLWTLSTEEQFYVVWPTVLVLVLRRRLPARRLTRALALVVAAIVVYRILLVLGGAGRSRLYTAPDTSCDGIVLGCLVAIWHHRGTLPRLLASRRARSALALPALAGVVGVSLLGPPPESRQYYLRLLPLVNAMAALVVLSAVSDGDGPVARLLRARFLVWSGKISYSLYLVHPLILWQLVIAHVVLRPAQAVVLSFVAAVALHRLVEVPLRNRLRGRRDAPALPRRRPAAAPAAAG